MNKDYNRFMQVFDQFSLGLQSLNKVNKAGREDLLIGVDYREEASTAPFQYDTTNALLHKTGCKHIDEIAELSIFGVWNPNSEDLKLACKKCNPGITRRKKMEKDNFSDMAFGIFSLIDQFGSALTERGKEYKKTQKGKMISKSLDTIDEGFGGKQEQIVDLAISSMDEMINKFKTINSYLNSENNAKKQKPEK